MELAQLFSLGLIGILSIHGLPIIDETTEIANNTGKNLYVVRAVVYEVGILANVSSSEEESESDSNEEIDLAFFHQHHNGSIIDLSNIPAPLQTNISRQIITGIAPVNLGAILTPGINETSAVIPLSFAAAQVSLQSNVSTVNATNEDNLLSNIAPLLSSNFTLIS